MFDNPAIIGVIVALPSFTLGYLAYRRSLKVDKVTEQSGIASSKIDSVKQVIDGLNGLIDNLTEDNKTLRENVSHLSVRLKEITIENDVLSKEIKNLNQKYNVI